MQTSLPSPPDEHGLREAAHDGAALLRRMFDHGDVVADAGEQPAGEDPEIEQAWRGFREDAA